MKRKDLTPELLVEIQSYYDLGNPWRKTANHFGFKTATILNNLCKEGILKSRTASQASSIKRHTEKSKQKISNARKRYLKLNPDKVPYKINHYSNGPSYPERYWKKIFDKLGIEYEEQYSIYLYSLDFAIPDKKIDIEIDGEQHYLDKRIIESDVRRNKYLENLGWSIIRVRWSTYKRLSKEDREKYVKELTNKIKRS